VKQLINFLRVQGVVHHHEAVEHIGVAFGDLSCHGVLVRFASSCDDRLVDVADAAKTDGVEIESGQAVRGRLQGCTLVELDSQRIIDTSLDETPTEETFCALHEEYTRKCVDICHGEEKSERVRTQVADLSRVDVEVSFTEVDGAGLAGFEHDLVLLLLFPQVLFLRKLGSLVPRLIVLD